MKYAVLILPRAQKELEKIPKRDYADVRAAILALAQNAPGRLYQVKGARRLAHPSGRLSRDLRD